MVRPDVESIARTMMTYDDEIADREIELSYACCDLLSAILDGATNVDASEMIDICEDLKDYICEYLVRKYALRIRRPMWLTDECGDFYAEYPYEHMEFDETEVSVS